MLHLFGYFHNNHDIQKYVPLTSKTFDTTEHLSSICFAALYCLMLICEAASNRAMIDTIEMLRLQTGCDYLLASKIVN